MVSGVGGGKDKIIRISGGGNKKKGFGAMVIANMRKKEEL
jgi:hypothetical protein